MKQTSTNRGQQMNEAKEAKIVENTKMMKEKVPQASQKPGKKK